MPGSSHTHLQTATSPRTDQSLQKSVLFTVQKESQFFFSLPSEKIKTLDPQAATTKSQNVELTMVCSSGQTEDILLTYIRLN